MASAAPHLEAFLEAARSFVGLVEDPDGSNRFTDPRGNEMFSLIGEGWGSPWCAALVSACAVKAGIDWVLIATSTGVGGVTSTSVDYLDAEWVDGPYLNGDVAVTPIPGDLISFAYDGPEYSGYMHGSHIGIVTYVDDNGYVHTIEGNAGNMCTDELSYAPDFHNINGYCRPNWASLGDNINGYLSAAGYSAVKGPLYANRNDRHDMTIRQVGYLDNNYALTNNNSNIGISIINYTTLLGDLYDMFAPVTQYKVTVDTSQLPENQRIAMDYFLSMGYSASAASAITGSLKKYSNLTTTFSIQIAVVNNIIQRLEGVAAWNSERIKVVKQKLGYEWNMFKNYSGQLECVLDELNKDYADLVENIKQSPLNIVGVDQATTLFMRTYNDYFANTKSIQEAKAYAEEIYNKLVITTTATTGYNGNLYDESGNLLTPQKSVDIPSSVDQTGVIGDYTSYSYWYSGTFAWGANTTQRKLADIWAYYGFAYENSIALIGGYYCIAVSPTFGSCGDVVVVTLENGSQFAAIIADTKNESDSNYTEWGHIEQGGGKYYGKIKVIEWQRVCTNSYGEVITEGSSSNIVDSIDLGEWYEQRVVNITNYGSYLT